jgi:hypothetical protein
MTSTNTSLIPWKKYIILTAESFIAFYLASFCLAMFFVHRGPSYILPATLLIFLYLFTIFVCLKRILQNVPVPGLMLAIPIIPLIALFVVISLIPIIQAF